MKETDLYEPIKQWMEERGFTAYPEVECRSGGGRADIVVTSGAVTGVVEMKRTLSLELLDQALRWRGYANLIWIAIPHKQKKYKQVVTILLRDYGIGLLAISKTGRVWCIQNPRFSRRIVAHLREALSEHHLNSGLKGGHSGGGYITPYRITMNSIRHYLMRAGGWRSIRDILDHCETHYASPRASLAKALQEFEASWCEKTKEQGKLLFRYREQPTNASSNGVPARKLTETQLSVLLVLHEEEWLTPSKILQKLPGIHHAESRGTLHVNQILKALIGKKLAEKNHARRGEYRLTSTGASTKADFQQSK
ncbi:MAG: hypothetical protein ACM32O_13430 [Clostridia bacterium]